MKINQKKKSKKKIKSNLSPLKNLKDVHISKEKNNNNLSTFKEKDEKNLEFEKKKFQNLKFHLFILNSQEKLMEIMPPRNK